MTATGGPPLSVKRVMVATDRSQTAERAVHWAANLAASYGADLLLLQVLLPVTLADAHGDGTEATVTRADESLRQLADELAGSRGQARVVVHDDPAQAIVDAVAREGVDVVVVGNVGMAGRKEFLLGNIPNRVSHNAGCTVVIVNTANLSGRVRTASEETTPDGATPVEGTLLARAWRIGRVMVRAGIRELRARPRLDDEVAMRASAQRLRGALDELGPTFAKLGQILSTRPDLLPRAFVEELASLQDRVTPLTEAEVVSVMEEELGVPWEDIFDRIDPTPMAAGTIAQVHRATLETGERVVVKVQRPTAERDILQDLGLLEIFARKAADRPAFRRTLDLSAVIEHLSTSLRRELDFRREAANIRRMHQVLEPFSRLDVPCVYEEYSTARLLVMEEIGGVPILQAPPGPERQEAARQLLEAYYHQVMTAGFFHADPHPGNMKWWKNKIYFLDLGMVGEVDAEARHLILLLLLAFSQEDVRFLSEVILMLAATGGWSEPIDLIAFQDDIRSVVSRYRDLPLREMQLGPILQEIGEISIRHNVRVPAALTLTGKAFAQMQLVAAELDPTLDPFDVAQSYILRNTLRQLTRQMDPQTLFYESQKVRARLSRILEAVEGAVGARPGANLQVDFRGTEGLEDTINRASRRLALALGVSGTLVAAAMAANSERAPRWVPGVMGSIGSILGARLIVDRARHRK